MLWCCSIWPHRSLLPWNTWKRKTSYTGKGIVLSISVFICTLLLAFVNMCERLFSFSFSLSTSPHPSGISQRGTAWSGRITLWKSQTLAWAGWWLATPTLPTLGPNSPLNGLHLRALHTTPSPSSLMSGVSNTYSNSHTNCFLFCTSLPLS